MKIRGICEIFAIIFENLKINIIDKHEDKCKIGDDFEFGACVSTS